MKLKNLFLTMLLATSTIFASGVGIRASLVFPKDLQIGTGVGVFGIIDFNDFFALYPGLDFTYATQNEDYYWNGHNWVSYNNGWGDFSLYEVSFNIDAMLSVPVNPVTPFFGAGIAPTIVMEYWDNNDPYYVYHHQTTNVAFNVFGGIKFPLGNYTGICELRGKLGSNYDMFKLSIGILFDTPTYHYTTRRHRRDRD